MTGGSKHNKTHLGTPNIYRLRVGGTLGYTHGMLSLWDPGASPMHGRPCVCLFCEFGVLDQNCAGDSDFKAVLCHLCRVFCVQMFCMYYLESVQGAVMKL